MQRLSKKIAHVYLVLGIVLSIGMHWHLYRLESESIDHQFRREVDRHSANIEQMLAQHFEIVHGLANALGLFSKPELGAFVQLSEPVRRQHQVIASLSWYWKLEHGDRAALESKLAQQHGQFEIKAFEGSGNSLPAKDYAFQKMDRQAQYMPMIAAFPKQVLDVFLGLDLYSRSDLRPALDQAVAEDEIYVSGTYHSGQQQQLNFAVFSPIFHVAAVGKPRQFTGFVSATFAIDSLLRQELQENLGDWVVRIQAPYNRYLDPAIYIATPTEPLAPETYSYQRNISVGFDRQWQLYARPSRDYVSRHRSNAPLAALLVGLALTSLIYYIWLNQLYRSRNIESLVAERTEALSAANKRLQELSQTDALTGVANRRLFEERLHHEWLRLRRAKKFFSLMMIDVDYFKLYNDYYGHQQGDDALVRIARCIADTVQRPADLVARYGGEEFIVLLPDTDDKALELADDILRAIRRLDIPHPKSRIDDRVTVSIGFGFAQANQLESPQQLIIAADKAMYHAKASGRNRIAYAMADSTDAKPVSHPA
jgi:diguanylate cyclase (GGDEF)-like protein